MEIVTLHATVRQKSGKGVARKLRQADKMPAVLNRKDSTLPLAMEKRPLLRLLNSGHGRQTLLNLKLENATEGAERKALVSEYQVHPVTGELIHVDFREVRDDEKVTITVPVDVQGTPVGVKEGGIMQRISHEVQVECLPADMMDSISVDVSAVDVNQTVHAMELELPKGAVLKSHPEMAILTVSSPRTATELEEQEGEGEETAPAEGEEAEAPAEAEKPEEKS